MVLPTGGRARAQHPNSAIIMPLADGPGCCNRNRDIVRLRGARIEAYGGRIFCCATVAVRVYRALAAKWRGVAWPSVFRPASPGAPTLPVPAGSHGSGPKTLYF